ncbi:hypothetical protein APHAL10511_005341 [Amanita phalloides]|nr:hypothetical protein APHAL10511_005341 [Amanita phalloides]
MLDGDFLDDGDDEDGDFNDDGNLYDGDDADCDDTSEPPGPSIFEPQFLRSREHAVNDVRGNTTAVFETQFNDILAGPKPGEVGCVNKSSRDRTLGGSDLSGKVPDAPDYTDTLRFALQTFYACRANMVRDCNNPRCLHYKDQLNLVMPRCDTWPGLRRWALQEAACTCYRHDHVSPVNIIGCWDWGIMAGVGIDFDPGPAEMSYDGKPAAFTDWARQLNVRDVLNIFSWLEGIISGKYNHFPLRLSSSLLADIDNDRAINWAISRAYERRLCPHRIWAICLNLPGRESNIPALIPDQHHPCSHQHKFCSTGLSHKNCTFDYCEISAVNFTNVVQFHRPDCAGKCKKKKVPFPLLNEAAEQGRPTAWAIDGELRPLESGERYMAISHVWSDGTGGSGSVNKCLYDFFCDIARRLKCKGLWWDAICIPQDRLARAKAIDRIHEYYSQAACTVVHDLCLATSEWIDGNHASFALVMSNWFTRGWTALELARSARVEVLFSTREFPGYVLKNLDKVILSHRGTVSSLSRILASTAIRSLRGEAQLEPREFTINDVLTSLGPRFTSWTRDRAIITGLFIGIDNPADDQHGIYRQAICKIGKLSSDQLFHNATPSAGPFAWFPSNLFDLPISSTEPDIQVLEDGSIIGDWYIFPDASSTVDECFFWDMTHPMTKHRVREALNDRRHIILLERQTDTITRGVLVQVRRYKDQSNKRRRPILSRYIGPVYFRAPQLEGGDLSYRVIIGDGGVDLDMGVSALDYIHQFHQPRTIQDELDELTFFGSHQ